MYKVIYLTYKTIAITTRSRFRCIVIKYTKYMFLSYIDFRKR